MLEIRPGIMLNEDEVVMSAMTAQGSGGQNVNKVASAIHLRFDIQASSLPEHIKERLMTSRDRRISREGVIIIKAQRFRQQDKNRTDALNRLAELLHRESEPTAVRKSTRPSRAAKKKRLENKTQRAQKKSLRKKIDPGSY